MTTELIVLTGVLIGVLFCFIGVFCWDRHLVKKIKLHNKKMEKENENSN